MGECTDEWGYRDVLGHKNIWGCTDIEGIHRCMGCTINMGKYGPEDFMYVHAYQLHLKEYVRSYLSIETGSKKLQKGPNAHL